MDDVVVAEVGVVNRDVVIAVNVVAMESSHHGTSVLQELSLWSRHWCGRNDG